METDALIGRYCGSSQPAPILSSSNYLWIRFRSDSSVSQAGFRAVYTVGESLHIYTYVHHSTMTLKPLTGQMNDADLGYSAMFSWETLGPCIHVDVLRYTFLDWTYYHCELLGWSVALAKETSFGQLATLNFPLIGSRDQCKSVTLF